MKTCDEAKTALVDLVFGELEDEVEIRLHHHLRSCPSCRFEEQRLIDLRDGLGGRNLEPSVELRERIRAALPRRRARRAGLILSRPIPAYMAVATGLIGALLVAALSRSGGSVVAPVRDAPRPGTVSGASFVTAGAYDTGVKGAFPPPGIRDSPSPHHRDSI